MMRLRYLPILLATLCFAAIVFWQPATAAQPQQSAPPFTGTVVETANLRAGPATTYNRIGGVPAGQKVQVVACNDVCTWYKLDSGSWIFAKLVQAQGAAPASASEIPDGAISGTKATAAATANLRSGPGTGYARAGGVSAGQVLDITGRNEAGDWYQLRDGTWIAAFLVNGAPGDLPVAAAAVETKAPETTAAPPEPAEPAQPAGSPNITIRYVNYDGAVYRVESDEYVEVRNTGSAPANLAGWMINAGDPGQNFSFPSYELGPGESCRVYTNEYHPDSGGFSFGRGQAIWNNKGDCGYLYDASGSQVDSYCY